VLTAPLRTMRAVVVSGGELRTTAPGASRIASSPCSIACNVETVLLKAMSMRPDCSTGTASAPLSNFVTSTSSPSALKNPCRSAMTAPSDSENGSRPSRIFSCAIAASGDARTQSGTNNEHTMGRKTATAPPVLFDIPAQRA
jgi:hypothetical protein